MSDIKLFRIGSGRVAELPGHSMQIEKTLQNLFEANLEALLGVRLLASEHSTGHVHNGRIDTLGIDENGSPVIIEYKRSIKENVINQGLFYLDWLLDHKGDFERLVHRKLGADAAENVDWSGPRLLCIAGEFTRYDEHAIKQIGRNIELLRYIQFGDDMLMVELVYPKVARNAPVAVTAPPSVPAANGPSVAAGDPYLSSRISYRLAQAPQHLKDIFESLSAFLTSLGDDVQVKELKYYLAFKRIKNFACIELWPQAGTVGAYVKLDPKTVALEPGFTRDVTKIGHFGTGDLEVIMRSMDDFAKAQPLFQRAYDGG